MLVRILKLPLVLLLLGLTAAAVMQARIPISLGMPSFRAVMAAGRLLLVIAFVLGASAMLQMRRHRTTVEPGHLPSSLVTSGIFGRTRNPIYLAMVIFVLAVALMTNGAWFVVAAIVVCGLLDRIVIASEERMIGEAFGEEYAAYRQRVRRWI
jgi:protein-S-isoprenylcysteine O-methyltransferase Ste14